MRNTNRLRLFICLLLALSGTHVNNANACTDEDLAATLSYSRESYVMLLRKAEFGWLYSTPAEKSKNFGKFMKAREELRLDDAKTGAKLLKALVGLNSKHETKILLYGYTDKGKCAWLISGSGQVLSNAVSFETKKIHTLVRDGLGVTSTNRTPRSSDECPATRPKEAGISDELVSAANQALREVSASLLPRDIATSLANDPATTRLIIVPFGDLRSIPFSALPLGDSGLSIVDKFAVVVSPQIPFITNDSATNPAKRKQTAGNAKYLVVGDPDLSNDRNDCWAPLPHALEEARYVAQRIGGTKLLTGGEATFDSVKASLGKNAGSLELIFFATHGVSNEVDPADKSFLALKGSHLRGSDIRKLKMTLTQKPIVVMSACQSGLGKTFAQGMFGLVEVWRNAGASQIIASLWNVDDEGTGMLMKNFVNSLSESGFDDAEFAMAKAMRDVRRTNPHPLIWASFNVFGEPTR